MEAASESETLRPAAAARSRSRSRQRSSNPNELLQRKLQMQQANVNQSSLLGTMSLAATLDSELDDELGNGTDQSSMRSSRSNERKKQQQQQQQQQQPTIVGSAQDRLEDLSEKLRSHQASHEQVPTGASGVAASSIDDVYILLAKKDKDLQLAAELGKVLLEKNEELSKANERITEDYSHQLELLEQDKHKLKRKLDLLNGEYENRLIELQTDCNLLKKQLEEQQQEARKREKEKSKLIDDLAQQNQRLTANLAEVTKSEKLLSGQLEQMHENYTSRLSNRQDHDSQLDGLKEEICIVNQRKQDFERRLKLAEEHKRQLSLALEQSGDRLLELEGQINDKEAKLDELLDELVELRDSSSWLTNELESMIQLNEKLASQSELDGDGVGVGEPSSASQFANSKRSQLIEQLRELRMRTRSRVRASELMLVGRGHQDERRRRRHNMAPGGGAKGGRPRRRGSQQTPDLSDGYNSSGGQSDSSESAGDLVGRRQFEWSEQAGAEIYNMLRNFLLLLQQRRDALQQVAGQQQHHHHHKQQMYSPNSAHDSGISADDMFDPASGELQAAKEPSQWSKLLAALKACLEDMPCTSCQLMVGERAKHEQLAKLHSRLIEQVRLKDDELLKLRILKTEQETRLAALEERAATLEQDLSNCDMPKEEIVKLAWKRRDEAVERKNSAEIALAKTRIENMQISSQLMEVVQQKGELSIKLAQFEDDIHYFTLDSVKAKFTWEEYAEKLRRSQAGKGRPDPANGRSNLNPLNPLAQLLNFTLSSQQQTNTNSNANANRVGSSDSRASSSRSSTDVSTFQGNSLAATSDTTTTTNNNNNNSQPANQQQQQQTSIAQAGGNLMRNLASNRFKLRFWQRSSSSSNSDTGGSGGDNKSTKLDNTECLDKSVPPIAAATG